MTRASSVPSRGSVASSARPSKAAGGYDEAIGFTVYDTLRYREALQPLVEEEVRVLIERLSGDVDPDAAVEIMRSGREPLRDLIGAMHSKLLLAELERRR